MAPSTEAPAAKGGLPVDPAIEPVSRSNPSKEARAVLESCGIQNDSDFEKVEGMGFVKSARDLTHYVNLTGKEPEIDGDGGAWAIAMVGEVPQPMSHEIWVDPTCVLIDGEQGWFATGGAYKVLEGGEKGPFIAPEMAEPGPDRALPSLAP